MSGYCGHSPVFSRRDILRGGGCCVVGAGLAGGLTGCITQNRATGASTLTGFSTLEDDIELGREQHPTLVKQFGGEYDDPRIKSYVTKLGNVLARYAEYQEFPYTFTVLNSWIVNAFALPGGFVYVSRGLVALASNEAELAGVLAHEIGHVNARHTAQRITQSQIAQGLLLGAVLLTGEKLVGQIGGNIASIALQSFSREQEFEADSLGVRYMSRAGYNPEAMSTFLDTLRDHSMVEAEKKGLPPGKVDEFNIMATHPRTIERVQRAEAQAAEKTTQGQVVNRERYLEKVDGMLYGDDPKQGLVRGQEFIHPDLRFRFEVPEDFQISNRPDAVIAQHPDSGSVIVFDMATSKSNDPGRYLRDEWADNVRLSDFGNITVNGEAAATGMTRIDGLDMRAVVIKGDGKRMFRFRYITDPAQTRKFGRRFRKSTYSFRRLSKAEAAKVAVYRMIVVPISPGDTVASLSAGFPEGKYSQAAFRLLNDLKPRDTLPKTGKVKVAVS